MTNHILTKIAVSGAGGRMGGRIISLASESSEYEIAGAFEMSGHPAIGRDAGLVAGCGELKTLIVSDCAKAIESAEVLIDFTLPQATRAHLDACVAKKKAIVIGTTGIGAEIEEAIEKASRSIPIIAAPNMSVGVNLLFRIAPMIARALGDGYDIEIVEAHHNKKKDSPSGTALKLLDGVAEARGLSRKDAVHGREGAETKRKPSEIGVHAVRAGDIVGEHTIYYATGGERIELTHRASSRDTFAIGALRAAKFLAGKPAGRYSMADVLFPE